MEYTVKGMNKAKWKEEEVYFAPWPQCDSALSESEIRLGDLEYKGNKNYQV